MVDPTYAFFELPTLLLRCPQLWNSYGCLNGTTLIAIVTHSYTR